MSQGADAQFFKGNVPEASVAFKSYSTLGHYWGTLVVVQG